MAKSYICVGGQEDGKRVTLLHGRLARFPKRIAESAKDYRPSDDLPSGIAETVEYDVRLINFKDGASVEFLVLTEMSTPRAMQSLLDAYARSH